MNAARTYTQENPTTIEDILKHIHTSQKDKDVVKRAYEFAARAHEGQTRYSGDSYINHPATAARYLAEVGMQASMVAAELLHDTIEDADIDPDMIEQEFGKDIRNMVEGVTKLGKVRYRGTKRHTESLRKLFAATSQDVRVMIIKLMDRLHNARTLEHVPADKRERIAFETIEIYAPIAERLGMGLLKRDLEDASFEYAYPAEYEKVYALFKEAGGEDDKRLDKVHKSIKKKLAEYGVKNFRTAYRVKSLYSFFRKLERKDWDISKIRDIWALRIIVPTVSDCYTILGIVHAEWHPIPGRLKDYIACPKPNGYRSIHTTIHTGDGGVLEVQIRTEEMHREAQFGVASHFSYDEKKTTKSGNPIGSGLAWIQQFIPAILVSHSSKEKEHGASTHHKTGVLDQFYTNNAAPEWIKSIAESESRKNSKQFLNEIKSDFFTHRIFVFTPRGDVVDLPINSGPIDFAFAIHSDIGMHTAGAKINGKLASLDTKLSNGDIVEIETTQHAKPTRKWLDMVQTTMARRHIRAYLNEKRKKK